MEIIPLLLKEQEQEAQITRKMLSLVPDDKYNWKPHVKSMTMQQLATHVAHIASWPDQMFNYNELDLATGSFQPSKVNNTAELLELLEKSVVEGKSALSKATEADLQMDWTLRSGGYVIMKMTKYEALRHSFSQTIHHRAQLGVYLRLLNIPIPGSYGPSADEMS